MSSKKSISVEVDKIKKKIVKHKEEIRLLEAKISYLQNICLHPRQSVETSTSSDYKGGTDHHWHCKDCGLTKVT